MPRANRRRDDGAPLDLARVTGGMPQRVPYAGGEWFVRRLTGAGARTASYRCPGCQLEVAAGVAACRRVAGGRGRRGRQPSALALGVLVRTAIGARPWAPTGEPGFGPRTGARLNVTGPCSASSATWAR
ncbi:MAG: hypothetical protein V9G15_01060 [Dermatophilaceae bacterium]